MYHWHNHANTCSYFIFCQLKVVYYFPVTHDLMWWEGRGQDFVKQRGTLWVSDVWWQSLADQMLLWLNVLYLTATILIVCSFFEFIVFSSDFLSFFLIFHSFFLPLFCFSCFFLAMRLRFPASSLKFIFSHFLLQGGIFLQVLNNGCLCGWCLLTSQTRDFESQTWGSRLIYWLPWSTPGYLLCLFESWLDVVCVFTEGPRK